MRATTVDGQNALAPKLQHKFHVIDSQMCVIRLRVTEGSNAHDQTAFCAIYSFLVEVQTNAGFINAVMRNSDLGRVVQSWVKITQG